MKWHKRLKYAVCQAICRGCEWVRQMVCDEPTYEELEERIFDLECERENLKEDNYFLTEENDWMARKGGYR